MQLDATSTSQSDYHHTGALSALMVKHARIHTHSCKMKKGHAAFARTSHAIKKISSLGRLYITFQLYSRNEMAKSLWD